MALPKLTTPTYTMTIPSTGQEIDYRPYLVKEEKVLMIAMESDDGKQITKAIKDVVQACTMDKVDGSKLTLFDIEYMFTKLRSKSVGETSRVTLPCENCEATNEVTINIDTLRTGELPNSKIELTSDTGLIMKFPNLTEYMELVESDMETIDKIFALAAASIEEIYSGDEVFDAKSQTKAEMVEFVEGLNAQQFAKIKEFIDGMPQATIDVNFKCVECSHDNNIELRGLRNFFN
jgi:hypothetical protein